MMLNRMWGLYRRGLAGLLGGLMLAALAPASAQESVCAVVKMEIQQELTLERQAFDAHMRINNGLDAMPLENVAINVTFADEDGASVLASSDPNNTEAKFFIRVDSMDGIADIGGDGVIQPSSSADIHWLIIPAPGAGGEIPSGKLYFVGASLSYTFGGEPESMSVTPDSIYVKPLPLLTMDYFLTKEIYADDPFTPEVEASEPFTLGVRVSNNGAATATNVQLDSAQPRIVENEQGLPIDFRILGSSINDQPAAPTLLADFGNIPSNGASVARWDMITTLSGQFTEFTATVSHADELGGQLTSLIEAANTHFLVHDVLVDLPGRDPVRDFLARDGDVLRVYESERVDTDVTDQSAGSVLAENGTDGTYTYWRLTAPVTDGFMYVQLPDSFQGSRSVAFVQRNDGKTLPPSNAWFSKKRNADNSWSHYFNLFDVNTTGAYTIALAQAPLPPEFQPVGGITTWETNPTSFSVTATDPNGTVPTLSATRLPSGASFTDQGNGTGVFTWTPEVGQAGLHTVTFIASDGVLQEDIAVGLQVNPVWDTDGDGMDDAWEREHFGDLSRDGTGDFDGDGVSDLDEFLQGYDPTLPPPPAPAGLTGEPGNEENTLSWPAVEGAVAYNLYWGPTPDFTAATGQKIAGVEPGYVHGGLVNETAYYYRFAVIGAGGESAASSVISVTPGIWDWNTPVTIEGMDAGDAAAPSIALNGEGQGVAVWSQSDDTRTGIWTNHFVARSGWNTPVRLDEGPQDAATPRVAIDGAGNAIAAWQQFDGTQWQVVYARYAAASGWSAPAVLGTAEAEHAYAPRIAMNAAGKAIAVWTQGAGETGTSLWAAELEPGAGWSTPARIEARTANAVVLTELTIDGNGNALALWSEGGNGTNILANRLLVGSGWAGETVLRSGGAGELRARGMLDGQGNALVAWAESGGSENSIYVDRYLAGTGWSSAEPIETAAGEAGAPAAAMNGAGEGVVVWTQSEGDLERVFVNRLSETGWTGAVRIDSSERGSASAPQVGMDAKGNILALWEQFDGIQQNIWAAAFDPDTGWAAAQVIETENAGDAGRPRLAIEPGGDALAVWPQSDGMRVNLWANDYLAGNGGVPNIAPIPVADDLTVDEQITVVVDGSGSFDQDGTVAAHAWTQVDGPTMEVSGADTVAVSFTAPTLKTAAVLTFRLVVTDDAGATGRRDVTVTVNPVNHPPVVDAGPDQRIAENTLGTLAGTAEDPDADGVLTSYAWTQTEGPAVSLENADTLSASFTAPAVYQDTALGFRLTVTDDEGGVSTDTVSVVVYSTNPDDDGDGMDDLWEIEHFGTLDRDGTGDYDGDGATDAEEFGFGTDPTVAQGPGEPEIETPDDVEVESLHPALVVLNAPHHPSFPVIYRFEVYSDAEMTALLASASGVTEGIDSTAWTLDVPLEDNTWHYWRVRAEGWVLKSEWVAGRFFVNTENDPPGPFYISSPKAGAWVDTFKPVLSVTNSVDLDEDALTYGFEVYADAAMTRLVTSVEGVQPGTSGSTSWSMDKALSENTWYWWRAVVTDEHGESMSSDSGHFFVNTRNDAPSTPRIRAPLKGAELSTLNVDLVVDNATDPEAEPLVYFFELDAVSTFDSAAKQVSGAITEGTDVTSWTAIGVVDNSWHYWRAKASDGRAESGWIQGSFFANAVNDPPGVPTPLNPGHNSWIGTLQPTLEVHPAIDVDEDELRYEFEVYSANKWGFIYDKLIEGGSDTTSWQLTESLRESGWYYWRARALDEHDLAGEWSQPVIFYADEDGVNDPPYIKLKKLKYHKGGVTGPEASTRGSLVEIRWTDRDPDSNATISLYYDDNNWGADGTLIADGIMEDPDGRPDGDVYLWDVSQLTPGHYYVYAVISDGTSESVSYSPNVVTVGAGGAIPFIDLQKPTGQERAHRRAELHWQVSGVSSNATVSLYYDTDAEGADGTEIISGLPAQAGRGRRGRYQWDVSAVPEGEYYIYAVLQDSG